MHITEIKGAGAPLLMLHGWGQTHESLKPLAELLSDCTQPILVDLPGFGKSSKPPSDWTSEDYAHHLAAYCQKRGVEKLSLCGHSFGGKVALSFAALYPQKILNLVLISPSGLQRKRTTFEKSKRDFLRYLAKLIKWCDASFGTKYFSNWFIPRFGSADYQQAGEMRSILVHSVNEDITPCLSRITCPTLLLWGKKDRDTPLEMGQRMAQNLRNATLIPLNYHDHHPFNDVGAHLCATYIRSFIGKEIGK